MVLLIRMPGVNANKHLLIGVPLRDRHLTAKSKGAAGDLYSGRGLLALVLIQIDASLHPAHRSCIIPARDDVARAQVFFDVKLQELI